MNQNQKEKQRIEAVGNNAIPEYQKPEIEMKNRIEPEINTPANKIMRNRRNSI